MFPPCVDIQFSHGFYEAPGVVISSDGLAPTDVTDQLYPPIRKCDSPPLFRFFVTFGVYSSVCSPIGVCLSFRVILEKFPCRLSFVSVSRSHWFIAYHLDFRRRGVPSVRFARIGFDFSSAPFQLFQLVARSFPI